MQERRAATARILETLPMRLAISIALLVVAALLLHWGIAASESFASTVERTVGGTPTDRSIWFVVAGAVCGVIGLVGLVRATPRNAG